MDVAPAAEIEKLDQEVRIEQWFTTGDGHTTTRLVEKGTLSFDDLNQLSDRHTLAGHFCCQRRTDFGALTAKRAQFFVSNNPGLGQNAGLHRTNATALSTTYAFTKRKELLDVG